MGRLFWSSQLSFFRWGLKIATRLEKNVVY
jgi:hypothetical protein